jgi:hypothetical protein
VPPPTIGETGYGIRVPGLVLSPYAKSGFIDHQQLSQNAYLKFIEDDFLDGQRLNPATDGRPDARPEVAEENPGVGNLVEDFDFNQTPREPLLLPVHPAAGPASKPPSQVATVARVPAGRALPLQLVGSTEAMQSIRAQAGRVYVTLSCNRDCTIRVAGTAHLGSRSVQLSGALLSLTGAHARTIALSLSSAGLRALETGASPGAAASGVFTVTARTPGQPPASWTAHVGLALR